MLSYNAYLDRTLKIKTIFIVLGMILLLYPWSYWGYYAGDAIIHLVFGQNAAQGHFFEFNLGEKSSGESSVGYMLYISLFFRILPAWIVPLAIKIVNYIAWITFIFLFYRLLKNKNINNYITAIALFSLGLMPGSVYNSMNGMENVYFGLYILAWYYLAIQYSYFSIKVIVSKHQLLLESVFSLLLGVGAWIRPEVIAFFSIVLFFRLALSVYYKQNIGAILTKASLNIIACILPIILLSYFIHKQTGMWIQSSVIARTLLGKITSYHFSILLFDPKLIIRMLAYFPITFFWLIGSISFFKSDWQNRLDECFAIFVFMSFILIFTFISGVFQLSRYMIFLTPFWILIAARGLEYSRSYFISYPRYLIGFLFLLSLLTVYTKETLLRYKLGNNRDLLMVMHAPTAKKQISDALYHAMGNPKIPVIIAGGEVDYRYLLDNRFLVRCLDGRIDDALLKYFHKDSIDYIRYFKERSIQYFMVDYSIPSFNNSLPSQQLKSLLPGQHINTSSLRFTYIGTSYGLYKIDKV